MTTKVLCPTCKTEVVWSNESTFRPFCSNRCKQIDLGAWAEEKYQIPGTSIEDDTNPSIDSSN
jgi:endogenous inhibitor of DNA gyrase (YacG/DUF329 family)